jgi:hypothetical protein
MADLFLLPPVSNQIITSEPVEEVLMLRHLMCEGARGQPSARAGPKSLDPPTRS